MSDVEIYEDPRNEVIVPDENLVETTEESTTNVIEETAINIIVQDDSNNVEITEEVTNLIAEEQRLIIEPEVEVIKILRADTPGPVGPEGPPGPPGADAPAGANTALSNLITTAINASLFPSLDSAINLGSSTKYWANLYADRVYFNSTSYLDGATANTIGAVAKISINSGTAFVQATQASYALQVSNGSGTLAIGSDASATYIQSFGSRPLRINSAGNNTEITGGNLGVGFANPVHKIQVAGNVAPSVDSTYNLGTSSLFWAGTHTDNLYLGNTGLLISGSGNSISLGVYTDATAANKTENPVPATVLDSNSKGIYFGIGAFSGMYDYLYCADRNPSITATSNYGTVSALFDGDLANTLNIPIANLAATPWVLTVTNNTGDWGFTDVLKLMFTGHRLYSTSGALTSWKLETMDAGGIWYTEVERTGVSDPINLLAPNLHRTDQSPVYTDGASWHKVKAIRLTVSGATASGHSPTNMTISGMQLRNTRPSFSAADGIGALDARGGSVYGSIGLLTPSPTHTITLASTTSGISHYNTGDQTTNYERFVQYWSGNIYNLATALGGSGVARAIRLVSFDATAASISIDYGGTSQKINLVSASGGANIKGVNLFHTSSASSGITVAVSISPTINQSGSAGYTALLVNATESAIGSGAKNLLDLQIGGVSRYRVDNIGNLIISSPATSGIALYNTADQTTNYERVRLFWSSNVFRIDTGAAGTGTQRDLAMSAGGSSIQLGASGSYGIKVERNNTALDVFLVNSTGMTHSSAVQAALKITPVINQSGSGGYAGILLNVTETALGSGNKSLVDLQIGGTSKFRITNTGKIITVLAQTYTESNVTTSRSYDADVTTIDGLADIIGTLIADLRTVGIIN